MEQGERGKMSEKQFRFQDFEIWKKGVSLSAPLFEIVEELDKKRLFRFAEQLRGVTMSVTNNIAGGSGSLSDAEFANLLNMARRSVFEVANILILLRQDGKINSTDVESLLQELEQESRMILAFRNSLKC